MRTGASFPPAAASAIRVIHGPASPFYSDFAFGGVVEAFTAPDADRTTAGLGASSYGDVNGWVRSGRRAAAGGMLAALDLRREQGWRDNADYWLGNGTLRGWRRAGAGRVEGGPLLYGSGWTSPGFVPVDRYAPLRRDGRAGVHPLNALEKLRMPAAPWFRLFPAAPLIAGLVACSDDEIGPEEPHTPASAAVFLDGVDMRDGLILPAGETVRLEIRFFDEHGEEITGIAADHFASLGFLPPSLATVADVAGEHFQKDVTGGAELGTGTYSIGYGHDEAADELSFGPFDVTVVATGGVRR